MARQSGQNLRVAPKKRRLKGFSMVACALVLLDEQAKHFVLGGRAGASRTTCEERVQVEWNCDKLTHTCRPPSSVDYLLSGSAEARVGDLHLLFLGQRLDLNARARQRN